jgi:hypothetical protein
MPRDPRQCVGGPLDGHEVAKKPGKYTWITGRRTTVLLSEVGLRALPAMPDRRPLFTIGGAPTGEPRDGAALYENADGVLIYAGHRTYLCSCGAYHHKCEGGNERSPCSLGGSPDGRWH